MKRFSTLLEEAWLPITLMAVWLAGALFVVVRWARRWWRIAAITRAAPALCDGREVDALRRMENVGGLRRRVELKVLPIQVEPGIFGLHRPVLLWPEGLSARLDDAQLEAVVAHELCHVRRDDNLTGAMHMAVEAAFWFHPLVWWLETRLVAEREAACDEEVLELCGRARAYAESILKVCEFCVESPLACVAGVTGADLKKRLADIIARRSLLRMTWPKKLLLAAAAACVMSVPVVVGQAKAAQRMMLAVAKAAPTPVRAWAVTHAMISNNQTAQSSTPANNGADTSQGPAFEVATIKPSRPEEHGPSFGFQGRHFSVMHTSVNDLFDFAYGLQQRQIFGAPDWVASEKYDISAVSDGGGEPNTKQWQSMVKNLMADRLQLRFHYEKRELPVYALTVTKSGPNVKRSDPAEPGHQRGGPGNLSVANATMADIADFLAHGFLDRPVVDQTGLAGKFDLSLRWTPDEMQSATQAADTLPGFFTAIQEQSGLKLIPTKAPVDVLVIDRIEKPSVDGADVAPTASLVQVAQVTTPGAPANSTQPQPKLEPRTADGAEQSAAHPQGKLAGNWQGVLEGPGRRLLFKITEDDGKYRGTFYSIDQTPIGSVLSSVTLDGAKVEFAIQSLNWTYAGTLSADGNSIQGSRTQSGQTSGLNLEHVSADKTWTIPEPPKQMPANADPEYDVATIKPADPKEGGRNWGQRGRQVRMMDATVAGIMQISYGIHEKQIVNAPEWVFTEKWDIDGVPNVEGMANTDQMKAMFRKLLASRFGLKYHVEKRELPVYAIEVTKGGPKMTVSATGQQGEGFGFRRLGDLMVSNDTMVDFANGMQRSVMDRPVVDRTGLKEHYDFRLLWTPDESQFIPLGERVTPAATTDPNAPPSLSTAMEEQLGLKMVPSKAMVDVFVIDQLEKPSAN